MLKIQKLAKQLPTLTPEQTLTLIRLFNEPQRRQGQHASELEALKLVKLEPHWAKLTSLGSRALKAAWVELSILPDSLVLGISGECY